MNQLTAETLIADVLREFGHTEAEQLCPCTRFEEDLGLDSMDKVEAVSTVEDRSGIDVPAEIYPHLKTVRDLALVIANPQEG